MNAILKEISNLKDGECLTWPESDYGKAEIWLKNGLLFLFEIPLFGGTPRFVNSYEVNEAEDLIKLVEYWT